MIGSSASGSGKTGKLRIGKLPVAPSTVDKPSTARELDAHFSEFKAHFDAGLTRQRAGLYRALWLQGAAIISVLAALYALVGGG